MAYPGVLLMPVAAHIDDGQVVNISVFDDDLPETWGGMTIIGVPDDMPVTIGWMWDGENFIPPPQPEPEPPSVPAIVTARQIRLGLLQIGELANIEPALQALPEPNRSAAL